MLATGFDIARAALFQDAEIAPIGAPRVEVVALAKRDLKAGEVVDEPGGYLVYGEAEAAEETARGGHLPIGVAVGAKLGTRHRQGRGATYADAEGRLVDKLRAEQAALFGLAALGGLMRVSADPVCAGLPDAAAAVRAARPVRVRTPCYTIDIQTMI